MKVSLSIISRGRMLRLMVLTLYFELYYSGYHKNLIQQLCAPLCELSVCGRCLRWHTNMYKLVGFLFFFSYGGPVPFHPYLSSEPRLSQQHRSLTFSDKTIIVTRPYNFVDPAWGKIIFLSLGCLWQSSFFPSYFNIYFLFFLKNIHSVWMTPGKPSAWIKYALRVYGCHLALIQQRFENLVRDVSGAWHSVCFPDSLFSLSKLMCFYTYVCFTLPANRGLSIFLDHPNSKDLCAQDIFTLAYYSVFTAAYGFLIGILPLGVLDEGGWGGEVGLTKFLGPFAWSTSVSGLKNFFCNCKFIERPGFLVHILSC